MGTEQHTITVTLVDGTQVVVPDCLDQITCYVLQEQGDWFEDEIKFLRRLVQPGQTVVDIGANVGVYALSLARKVGPTGQVWAFEPASDTAALLEASIAANGVPWLHLERQALSDHAGTAVLQTPPGESEFDSLVPSSALGRATQQGPGEEVSLITLDACLQEFGWQQVDLLKIDAEGAEERILAGGKHFLAELSPLVMFELREGNELHLELVNRFQALGYGCYRLVPGLDALKPFDPADGVDSYLLNLFAAKPDRADALERAGWLVKESNPKPPGAQDVEPYPWRTTIAPLPYARELARRWEQEEATKGKAPATDALAYWVFANDLSQPLDRRLGALQNCYRTLREETGASAPPHRWSTLARVARSLGERAVAVRALGHLIPSLQAAAPLVAVEPFLPPLERYDHLDPGEHPATWLLSAALEADELLGELSGYYYGERSRARLEHLLELGFSSSERSVARHRLHLLDRRCPRLPKGSPDQAMRNEAQLQLSKQAWEELQGQHKDSARVLFLRARQMGINCPDSLHYLAKCLIGLGSISEAIALLQRAVELNPDAPAPLVELGLTLARGAEPQASEAVLQQAVFLYGFQLARGEVNSAEFANLAIAYDALGDTANALACLEEALQRDPGNEQALLRKAAILGKLPDHHEEAEAIWKELLQRQQGHLAALAQTVVLRITQGELAEAGRLLGELLAATPGDRNAHHQLAFLDSISGAGAVEQHLRHLRDYWAEVRGDSAEMGAAASVLTLPPSQGRLRVGILSAEIGDHVVSLFLEPFLRHHDRQRLEVELIEMKHHQTAWADELRALAHAVIPLGDVTRPEARRRIRSRAYHVIVETSGFTSHSGIELLAERCAPVQCHYIGFHASTGLDTIDWFIGDAITAAPELAYQYVEGLWRLPRLWLASCRPPHLPEAGTTLATGHPPVLGSFNQFGKVSDATLDHWAEALRLAATSELHLKSATSDAAAPRQRILQGLERRGIEPARVRFLDRAASYAEHLRCYNQIDIALDATPWAGATTSFEALAMGVPVVGILGGTTAGRMTCSILHALGQTDWIARDRSQFARIVAELARDVDGLRSGKAALQEQVLGSCLFDGPGLARDLQEAFFRMVRLKGLQTASTSADLSADSQRRTTTASSPLHDLRVE
ncbi:MAG: FkbM family methyltransferase [Cyanobium sp. Prado107]|nr:FkbM family methyltransferase [Cyanobium sp. Prado107]